MQSTEPLITEQDRDELVLLKHTPEEIETIEKFLSPFCKTARLYLVRIFVRGRVKKKAVTEILEVCSNLWESIWKNGTPGRLGDSDDVTGNIGSRNTDAYYRAYKALGLPYPKFLF